MVTFDAGLMQSEKMQLLQLSPPPGRAKRAMERDFSEALERLKVRSAQIWTTTPTCRSRPTCPSWRSTSRPGNKGEERALLGFIQRLHVHVCAHLRHARHARRH